MKPLLDRPLSMGMLSFFFIITFFVIFGALLTLDLSTVHPFLSAPYRLEPQSFSKTSPFHWWLAFLTHRSWWECLQNTGALALLLWVAPRREVLYAGIFALISAPALAALASHFTPPESSIGGFSAVLFFMASFISLQILIRSAWRWFDRILAFICVCLLISRSFFGLVIYDSAPLIEQVNIISRCSGVSLGLLCGLLFVILRGIHTVLQRQSQVILEPLN